MELSRLATKTIDILWDKHGKSPAKFFANTETLNRHVRECNDPRLAEFPLPNGLTAKFMGAEVFQDDTMDDNIFRCE